MKKGISKQAKIGIFGVTIVVLLYFGINFIKSKKIFGGASTFYVEYSTADGIEVSSPVLIKGFKVGNVDKVKFDISRSIIIVQMSIDKDYPIPVDSKAKITSTGLLGGPAVEVILGTSDSFYKSGDNMTPLYQPGLMSIAGNEYEKLKEQATTLIEQVSTALSGINKILSEQNLASLSGTLTNLNSMSHNLNDIVAMQRGNIESVIYNLNTFTANLNAQMPKLESTLTNLEDISGSVAADAPTLMANASNALNSLNELISKISEPSGTLGKLVNDEEIYQNLSSATNALTILLEDIKANPKRYVQVSVFGKKDKEKK